MELVMINHTEIIECKYVITPENLKYLNVFFDEHINNPNISVNIDCKDNISRNFDSIDEFINYENTKSKQIVSLYIHVRSEDYKKSVSIFFINQVFSSVNIKIGCEEKDLYNIKQGLIDIIHEMQPTYSWISVKKFIITDMIICFILTLSGSSYIYKLIEKYIGRSITEDTDLETRILRFVIWMTFFLISYFIGYKLGYKHAYCFLFPGGAYIIGNGKSRDEFRKKVLNLFIGALITLCVGIILLLLKQLIW